jgi:quercetin dioxygenase-like cupin family protein
MKDCTLARQQLCALIVATGSFLVAPGAMAQSSVDLVSLQWSNTTILPSGALAAVMSGDPSETGKSTVVVSMPDGYRIPPHFHPSYEHVKVVEGALLIGVGDELDPKRTRVLAAGDTATASEGVRHFSIARGRTVVAVTFMGPYTMTYLRAEDAPRPRNYPFGY